MVIQIDMSNQLTYYLYFGCQAGCDQFDTQMTDETIICVKKWLADQGIGGLEFRL